MIKDLEEVSIDMLLGCPILFLTCYSKNSKTEYISVREYNLDNPKEIINGFRKWVEMENFKLIKTSGYKEKKQYLFSKIVK